MLRVLIGMLLTGLLLVGGQAVACEQDCIDTHQWQIGVAIGAGVRTNPLVDGDNIPLVVLPDIAWYGERFYLDNDELGYQLAAHSDWAAEVFVNINKEAANFAFWHPANIFSNLALTNSMIGPSAEVRRAVSKDDVATRHWAVNGGVRLHWRFENAELQVSTVTDVSGVHNGGQAELNYSYSGHIGAWRWSVTPGLIWKSARLVDYYYGLDDRDGVDTSLYYEGRSGWYPSLMLQVTKPLAENWLLLASMNWTKLHKGMTDSPLLAENKIRGLFVGVAYHF
ncbi:MipA/OmpV family protein [Bowmanella pacifica]|uniref:Outer membrane MltA-interaction protein MipA n=2 Tax=Bowmanella TaxID=366580 RepID=A0A917YWG5_9ALTE|nr:MipA/OmpV family protein [Bowmanella pacifica]GGO66330.1 outer membrane MltA-interaction protein MipA [Bowmanella pacifica]